MSNETLLVVLFVSLVRVVGRSIVRNTGFGLFGDLLVGVVGAFVGKWLMYEIGTHFGIGIIGAIINATIVPSCCCSS